MAVITASIDVTKLDRTRFVPGKPQDRDGKTVIPQYADVTLIETRDSQYGDDYMIVQKTTKEERDQGLKLPILGNAKIFDGDATNTAPTAVAADVSSIKEDDDVPF